jgi:hypothetical protein
VGSADFCFSKARERVYTSSESLQERPADAPVHSRPKQCPLGVGRNPQQQRRKAVQGNYRAFSRFLILRLWQLYPLSGIVKETIEKAVGNKWFVAIGSGKFSAHREVVPTTGDTNHPPNW